MARIPMTSGFVLIPEGEYVFRIYDALYDEEFGKIEVKLVTAQGLTHTERFSLKDANDEWNEKALNAFSYFAKTALNDFSREDVDPEELINHYISAEVTHSDPQPNRNDPTKTVIFANHGDKWAADGFDETPTERALTIGKGNTVNKPQTTASKQAAQPTAKPAAKSGLDLDSLLG